jgi:outer membrane biogenesis lipoprotein LolB
MIRRLLPVLALGLLAACADVTGPQETVLSSRAIEQDAQTTQQQQHGTKKGADSPQKLAEEAR